MISSSSSTAVAPLTPSARPTGSRLLSSSGRTRVTAKATPTPWPSSTSSTMPPASIAARIVCSGGSATPGRTTSHITATGSRSARIVRVIVHASASGSVPNTSASSRAEPALGDLEVAHAERDAAPLRELGVGPQHLEPLVERGRAHRLADVGAGALAARDLARVREPVERRAQRST